jgi:hypothetical protein
MTRQGFIWADVTIGLSIVAVLAAALSLSIARQRRASESLAQSRAADRFAEQVLGNLHAGKSPPPAPDGTTVQVRDLGQSPARGFAWAQVTVTDRGKSRSMIGLARSSALPTTAPTTLNVEAAP